jgi:hypothetical protein
MGDMQHTRSGVTLVDTGMRPASTVLPLWLFKAIYSACCGAIATAMGAGASLAVAAADRIAVWCAVAGATCVGAGLIWHSRLVTTCREALYR